ncbi:hypothetical protein HKBW3S09_01772, partial [Candidatus Hakubella thermalkaliphila]
MRVILSKNRVVLNYSNVFNKKALAYLQGLKLKASLSPSYRRTYQNSRNPKLADPGGLKENQGGTFKRRDRETLGKSFI